MRPRIKKWQAFVTHVCNFRKPAFLDLKCIDLVADKKLLFLIAWDTVNTGSIKVNPGRHCYKSSVGAAIITLPPATTSVDIIIRNWWRGRKVNIQLKLVKLDQESLAGLINDLRLSTGIEVDRIQPVTYSTTLSLVVGIPQIEGFVFQTHISPKINHSNFTYHES